MTRLELFKGLCDITDDLQRLATDVKPLEIRLATLHIVDRLDGLVDGVVRGGMEPLSDEDASPCPHCGQDVCAAEGGSDDA